MAATPRSIVETTAVPAPFVGLEVVAGAAEADEVEEEDAAEVLEGEDSALSAGPDDEGLAAKTLVMSVGSWKGEPFPARLTVPSD